MKTIALVALLAACHAPAPSAGPDMPAPAKLEQHEWLHQLVGEWEVKADATMQPGTEPMHMESTELVRSLGGLWVVCEGKATLAGEPYASMMTLGYDPKKQHFVGTWVDTSQAHLWTYVGTLDEAKKVLSLSADGPAFDDPTKTAHYKDSIEVVGFDKRILTSAVQGADGTWTTFMRAEYSRKR